MFSEKYKIWGKYGDTNYHAMQYACSFQGIQSNIFTTLTNFDTVLALIEHLFTEKKKNILEKTPDLGRNW